MSPTSMPPGRDFEIALRYLDGELSEVEQMSFEIRLSDNAELERQYRRLAAIDAAQRRLAESGAAEPPDVNAGRTALLPGRRDEAPDWRNNGLAQLALAASLLLFVGALGSRILKRSESVQPSTTTLAMNGEDRDTKGTTRSASDRGESSPGAETTQAIPPGLFVLGVRADGALERLALSDATSTTHVTTAVPRPVLRRIGEPSAGQQIDDYVEGEHYTMPASADGILILIAGVAPVDEELFLERLDLRLAGTKSATQTEMVDWLINSQRVDVSVFSVEH